VVHNGEKAQLVMLKKSSMLPEEASPQAADLQRFRKMFAKPFPTNFIEAVTALVEKGVGRKLGAAEVGLLTA
jgi:hypothetical protein